MKPLARRVAVILVVGLCALGARNLQGPLCQAAGPNGTTGVAPGCPAQCAPCCCPDTYCPKPLPVVACLPRSCSCDTYCPKPLPRVPCVALGCGGDTYCPKPLPRILCPVLGPWYTCGPADRR